MLDLTYDTREDGLGGQYLRIVGLICLAKKYNLNYVHNKIKEMEHLPFLEYINEIDNYFKISSYFENLDISKYDEIYSYDYFNEDILKFHKDKNNKKILLKIKFAAPFIENKDINIYNYGLPFLRSIKEKKELCYFKTDKKNIAIHIRRGDVNLKNHPDRYVSIEKIKIIYDFLNKKYENTNFCIFTEINDDNKNEFEIFNNLNINIISNEDQIITFDHMVNSDVLFVCKSTYSYLAGMYNTNTVYCYNFWHKPLENWIVIK